MSYVRRRVSSQTVVTIAASTWDTAVRKGVCKFVCAPVLAERELPDGLSGGVFHERFPERDAVSLLTILSGLLDVGRFHMAHSAFAPLHVSAQSSVCPRCTRGCK